MTTTTHADMFESHQDDDARKGEHIYLNFCTAMPECVRKVDALMLGVRDDKESQDIGNAVNSSEFAIGATVKELTHSHSESPIIALFRLCMACGFDFVSVLADLPEGHIREEVLRDLRSFEKDQMRIAVVPTARCVLRSKKRFLEMFASLQFCRISDSSCPRNFASNIDKLSEDCAKEFPDALNLDKWESVFKKSKLKKKLNKLSRATDRKNLADGTKASDWEVLLRIHEDRKVDSEKVRLVNNGFFDKAPSLS